MASPSNKKALLKIAASLGKISNVITKSLETIDKQVATVLELQGQLEVLLTDAAAAAAVEKVVKTVKSPKTVAPVLSKREIRAAAKAAAATAAVKPSKKNKKAVPAS